MAAKLKLIELDHVIDRPFMIFGNVELAGLINVTKHEIENIQCLPLPVTKMLLDDLMKELISRN